MLIHEAEEKLFQEWQTRVPDLVRDGVVDEPAFLTSKPKLLFVLKEANDFAGGDLRDYLRGANEGTTLNNIVRWTRAIQMLPIIPVWSDINCVYQPERTEWLSKIAFINIKKKTGVARAIDTELGDAVKRDADLLKSQVELYDSDIAICCGDIVFDLLCFSALGYKPVDMVQTRLGIQYIRRANGKAIIRFHHPNTQWPAHVLAYSLLFAVAEISGLALELRSAK